MLKKFCRLIARDSFKNRIKQVSIKQVNHTMNTREEDFTYVLQTFNNRKALNLLVNQELKLDQAWLRLLEIVPQPEYETYNGIETPRYTFMKFPELRRGTCGSREMKSLKYYAICWDQKESWYPHINNANDETKVAQSRVSKMVIPMYVPILNNAIVEKLLERDIFQDTWLVNRPGNYDTCPVILWYEKWTSDSVSLAYFKKKISASIRQYNPNLLTTASLLECTPHYKCTLDYPAEYPKQDDFRLNVTNIEK